MSISPSDELQSTLSPISSAPATPATPCRPEAAAGAERRQRICKALDVILVTLVVALGAVLAAVPIRNSDAWMHLAVGRHLVTGPSAADTDPFVHTGSSIGSPGASWIFDVVIYGVYAFAESYGLGVCKVLAVALLAGALLWAGRAGAGAWLAAICAALAILAIAPWLHLQPILASMTCFVLTLGYLERRTEPPAEGPQGSVRASWASFWPLFALFVVWVNTDRWFLLGPMTLLVYWFGGLLPLSKVSRTRIPVLTVVIGFAVCLANPRLYHAWIPDELLLPVHRAELGQDPMFRPMTLSLLRGNHLEARFLGGTAGLALALLVICGMLAFPLNRRRWHTPRLLLCASLLGLCVYQARNAPFVALAFGVLVPQTLHGCWELYLRQRQKFAPALPQAVAGRFATAVLGVAIIVLAWVGHLQLGRPQPRGLGIEADPSLVRAAERIAAWRRDGKLGVDSLGFSDSPDAANYFAWFCPQEKSFFDSRLEVCADALSDFVLIRQGLSRQPADPSAASERGTPAASRWREVLRRRKIDHIILADRDRERTQMVLRQVFAAPDEWQVLFMAGRVLALAWHDPAAKGAKPPASPGVDLNYEGLHPDDAEKAPAMAGEPLANPSWLQAYLPVADPWSVDLDEAALRNMIFEALLEPGRRATAREWELALAAGAVGRAATGELAGPALRLAWLADGAAPAKQSEPTVARQLAQRLQAAYVMSRDDAPVGHLWAAVRACRRAVLVNGNDAEAYLLLGQVYCRLAWNTAERGWGGRLPSLGQLRMQQAIGALQQAVRINPELDQAHSLLATIYRGLGVVDLALRHLQVFHKLHLDRGPLAGESVTAFGERLDRVAQEVVHLEAQTSDRENAFERKQAGLTLSAQIRFAHSVGLTDKALSLLVERDASTFDGTDLQLALDLLLWTGRAQEGRDWLKPTHKNLLGEFEYHSLGARLAAATGNYAEAQDHLASLAARSALVPELGSYPVDLEVGLAFVVGKSVLAGLRLATMPRWHLSLADFEAQLRVQALLFTFDRTAEFDVLQGLVTLERGDADRAERHFRQAFASTRHQAERNFTFEADRGIHPLTVYYLRLLHAPRGK